MFYFCTFLKMNCSNFMKCGGEAKALQCDVTCKEEGSISTVYIHSTSLLVHSVTIHNKSAILILLLEVCPALSVYNYYPSVHPSVYCLSSVSASLRMCVCLLLTIYSTDHVVCLPAFGWLYAFCRFSAFHSSYCLLSIACLTSALFLPPFDVIHSAVFLF